MQVRGCLSPREHDLEIEDPMIGWIVRWDEPCDQKIRARRGHKGPVFGVKRLARKIHLRHKPIKLALNFDMNVRWPHPVRPHRIGAGLHSLDPIFTVYARPHGHGPDEVRICRN